MTRTALAAVGAVAIAALAGARLLWAPGLLGSPRAEVYGHAWVQWWQAPHWPLLAQETTALHPPSPWPVIDPLPTWIVAGLSHLTGLVVAHDLLVLGAIALAFAGGWALARRVGGHPWTGALTLACAPALTGAVTSGLTEDLGLGQLAFAIALMGRVGWRPALASGVLLGGLALWGPYLGLMGALGAIPIGLAVLRGDRARWRELGLTAVVAAVIAVAALTPHAARLGGHGHRHGSPPDRVEAHWRVNPTRAADVASLAVPGPDPVDDGALIRVHPAYLGWIVVGLAIAGTRRQPRWWALVAVGVLLALGPQIRFVGHPTGLPNPIGWLASALPVNHWGRLVMLAHVGLAALAALGASRLGPRASVLARVAVAADLALASPAPWPLATTDASIPAIHAALDALPAGAVVVVPGMGPGIHMQRPLYRQRAHGRPLALHPNHPAGGLGQDVPLMRWFASLPGNVPDPPDPRVHESLDRLAALGVAVILVEAPYDARAEDVLGPPAVRDEGGAAWATRGRPGN